MKKNNFDAKSMALAPALILILAWTGFGPAFAQDMALTGTVTDASGAKLKNAKVTLLGRNLTVLTGADGAYRFESATGLVQGAANARAAAPIADGGRLRFEVAGAAIPVRIEVFHRDGRLVRTVVDARLGAGEYRLAPFTPGMAPGNYLVRVRIGAASHSLILTHLGGTAGAASGPQWMGTIGSRAGGMAEDGRTGSGAAQGLRKTNAVVDTLSVVAMGFERGERTVEALAGTQDFKLNPLKWTNVSYRNPGQPACGQCILDVRKPSSGSKWPVIVHFHGGGMTGGDRNEPFGSQYAYFGQKYLDHGYMVVTPGYTLAGGNTTVWPQYLRDAAQAAVWIRKNIEPYGGDPNSVFITGFSAGAYLSHMLAIDTTWFKEQKYDARKFAGFISMSGQTRTHDNIRADLKVSDIMKERPEAMPMGHIRKTTVPWQITVGAYEGGTIGSNRDLYDALIKAGSTDLYFNIIPNQPHTCADIADAKSPKRDVIFSFVDKYKAK